MMAVAEWLADIIDRNGDNVQRSFVELTANNNHATLQTVHSSHARIHCQTVF